MAIASVRTKLSLDRWAAILGIHPLHFNGVAYTPPSRSSAACDGGFLQYDWQAADQVSREQIARAILAAERLIENKLQYHLAPVWDSEEWQLVGRPYLREMVNYTGRSLPMYRSSVTSKWKEFISGGVETKTLISAGRPITYTDDDGDGIFETATVTATVGENQAECEIEVYYPGHVGDDRYQIRSATVDVSGTTATITFKRWHAVTEAMIEALDPEGADPLDDDHFLNTVDVYRRWNDPSTQATLMWEPTGCAVCDSTGCAMCSYAVQSACLFLRSTPRVGVIAWSPGQWNSEDESFDSESLVLGRSPELVRLFYYSGLRSNVDCPNEMDNYWADVVTKLSLTFLDRPACQCTSNVWDYWRDVADLGKGDAAVRQLSNPFGPMRGAIYAWNAVTQSSEAVIRSAAIV